MATEYLAKVLLTGLCGVQELRRAAPRAGRPASVGDTL